MPPPKPTVLATAQPRLGDYFDPWNSSSTGHQRAESRAGSGTEWRDLRNLKLSKQFLGEGKREKAGKTPFDQAPVSGSAVQDENARDMITREVSEKARANMGDVPVGKMNARGMREEQSLMERRTTEDELKGEKRSNRERRIFDGLVVYVNGSTYPLISDHKLRQLLVENGARLSMHLGRRQVTHVILGRPSGTLGSGAGGGLAGSKIEKEIRQVRGCGIKYVGVEWVLESVKSGKRLTETRFSNLKVAAKGQQSVYGMLKKTPSTVSTGENSDQKGAQ